ncbi:class C beta-lactamase-related serine hydrolase [Paenibacillus nanensis]|uniref:Class C beta-lactamase-related serine hydrolase n=1 Tax=Paenibacillus nanensis TaxID=393251 RepID=A0A3A1UMN9_9BACL|nr:serine hydrolase [Paenibacillus nanensis]RIX48709.1 class C beta-lactamase-related serine hydrolase [Paenibacillus nanensis]
MKVQFDIQAIVEDYNQSAAVPFSGAVRFRDAAGQSAERGFGYANRSEQIRNEPDTRFGIASGCKIFTAVAICQLAEQGRLRFEDLLGDVLEQEFPRFDPAVNVHHLLTHSSGVPDYFDEEVMSDFSELWRKVPAYSIKTPSDFLPLFQDGAMKFSPGSRFSYCNSGFILLGLIVERLSGQSFTSYVEEHIFKACGMTDSGYFAMDRLPERTALGYIDRVDGADGADGAGWRTNHFSLPIIGGPDGGAFTTARDMEKFWDALLGNRLLSEEMTSQMLTPHMVVSEKSRYGYGVWMTYMNGELFKYYVMGSDPGVTMVSSAYAGAQPGCQLHVLGNIERGAGAISSRIDSALAAVRSQ